MNEEWRPIPGHPGYEASTLGRLRSVDRVVTGINGVQQKLRGRVLSPFVSNTGYLMTSLGSKSGNKTVHRLVCMAFHGEPGDGQITRHLNDVKTDNRPENLAWGTPSDNNYDAVRNGTWKNGNTGATHCRNGHELSGDNVAIRKRPEGGRACRACAREKTAKYQDANREKVREAWRKYARRKRAERKEIA